MSEIRAIGLDLAETVFQLHGPDQSGKAVLRKKLRRDQVVPFFSTQSQTGRSALGQPSQRHSRVQSSTTVRMRKRRPSVIWSDTKSNDHL